MGSSRRRVGKQVWIQLEYNPTNLVDTEEFQMLVHALNFLDLYKRAVNFVSDHFSKKPTIPQCLFSELNALVN